MTSSYDLITSYHLKFVQFWRQKFLQFRRQLHFLFLSFRDQSKNLVWSRWRAMAEKTKQAASSKGLLQSEELYRVSSNTFSQLWLSHFSCFPVLIITVNLAVYPGDECLPKRARASKGDKGCYCWPSKVFVFIYTEYCFCKQLQFFIPL